MAKTKDDLRNLTGPQRAAIFMLALGQEHSAKMFELMDDEEIRDMSQIMSTLGNVNSSVIERLFVDFANQLSGGGGGAVIGSYDTAERLLFQALPEERVSQIMEEIRGPAGRTMWDKLGNVNEAVLANYLKNEYPQTVAVVLSKVRADHAARVLAVLPENFSMEVIMRMLRMESVQKEVLDHIEKTLRTEFMTNLARTSRRDSHEMMADIFNNLDRNTETRFMTGLEERNRESAERIKQLMFTFDDLSRLDNPGIQTLLRQVEKDQLAMALKGASEEVKSLFFQNMSERAGKMMKEDMDAMGAVRLKEVDEAQAVIVTAAKSLADAGEIVIAGSGEEDELVY
ncbi:MAG: flagellar motor switch protein FliG [Rhodospirillaceae bacterium]|nr:flagellar motor switch protein FliG [Rhodospirillaceae bacterium]